MDTTIAAGAEGNIMGVFVLSGSQPVDGKAGEQLGDLLLVHPLFKAGDIGETFVGPDHSSVGQAQQHHGKRTFTTAGSLETVGGGLDEGLDILLTAGLLNTVENEQSGSNSQLDDSQRYILQQQSGNAKGEHDDKIPCQARL